MKNENNSVPSNSLDITEQNIEKLKELFPEILTENKIDFDKLRLILGDKVEAAPERYGFTWNGKNQSIQLAQQPTVSTLKPNKEKSKNWNETQNLYIEGDNLEVLKILQKSFSKKVKFIYIDPPYNTGKDFVYRDKFEESNNSYLKKTNQVNEEGIKLGINTETSGRYHTDWLEMMYPRLKLSRELLSEDGILFVSINDIEVYNLRNILNEIFGEKNFVADLIWTNKEGGGSSDTNLFRIKHEHILVFSKNLDKLEILGVDISNEDRYKYKDEYFDTRGPYYLQKLGMGSIQYSKSLDYPLTMPDGSTILPSDNNNGKQAIWRWSSEKVEWGINNGYIVFKKNNNKWTVYTKQYLNADNEGNIIKRTQRPMGLIDNFSSTQGSKELEKIGLGNFFSYPKPTKLIKYLLDRIIFNDNDIVLDFFSGSATTAEAVMQKNIEDGKNCKFIMVQLPEKLSDKDTAFKEGYKTIPEIAEERIRRSGEKIVNENPLLADGLDIGFKVFELSKSNIKKWNTEPKELNEQFELLANNFEEDSKPIDIVYEIMLKQGLELTYPISEIKVGDAVVYDIAFGAMFVVLGDKITSEVASYIIKQISEEEAENTVVVLQDEKFVNDSEKLNVIEQLNESGIEYNDILSI